MKTKVIIMTIVTVLLLAVTFKLKSNKQIVDANIYRPDPDKKVFVEASIAEYKDLDKIFAYTGTFAANREIMIVPQIQGEVEAIYFSEGDVVRKGALLIQIDDDVLQAQYIAADANFQNAKRNLDRYESAAQGGGVSKLQLDNLKLNLTNAESQLKQLAKQIELSKIVAPFAGTITFRDVEQGSVVGGNPVARITELDALKLEISVPEKEIILFHEGEKAEIKTDLYADRKIYGTTEYVADRADNAHNYSVRILVKNTEPSALLKAGMYGTVSLNRSLTETALLIPRSALLGSAKNPQVYVVDNGLAVLKNIHTGETTDETVAVLQGLHAGDSVVTSGHINLTSGSKVAILK